MKNIHQQAFQVFSKNIGVPYEESDCWDIVKKFYKEVLNQEISLKSDYVIDSSGQEWAKKSHEIVLGNASNFKKVKNPDFGDIILIRIWGITAHVGIFLDERSFLHTSEKTGCIIDSIKKWEKRIEGYYRWPRLD